MKRLNTAATVLGLGGFAAIIWQAGPGRLAAQVQHVWMGFALLVLLSLTRLLLQTRSWSISLMANGLSHPFGELIGMRVGCQSLGYFSMFGPLVSEPLKIRLLGTSTQSATATLVDTGLYWFTSVLLGIIGSAAGALLLMHKGHETGIAAFLVVLICGVVLLARKKSLLACAADLLGWRSPGWLKKGASIEREIRQFRFVHPQAFYRMFWADVVAQCLMAGEVAVMLWALGAHLTVFAVLAIEACTRAVKLAGGFLPARIGADEVGAVGAFVAFGLSPSSGLMLALARRSRDLLWCVCGLLWLTWNAHRPKTATKINVKEEVPCSW